jgi:hypothetical protein
VKITPADDRQINQPGGTPMNASSPFVFTVNPSELIRVLPAGSMTSSWMSQLEQRWRFESLTGDAREAGTIVEDPAFADGTGLFTGDVLHALVIRDAARHLGHKAEVVFDVSHEHYIILVNATWRALEPLSA